MSYRITAEKITEMTGQSISAIGIWNVIQALGDKVCDEEKELVKAHKSGQVKGNKEVPVLFEETDGVYVRLQREKKDKGEIKIGIAYDGWKKTGKDRYALDEKVVVAGFSKSKEFQEYREATIAKTYNLDETEIRIMNADVAEWVKNSLFDDDEIEKADQLITYLKNNREGLIPYTEKEINLPENKKGISISQHGNYGKSCMEHNSKTNET